MGSANVDGQKSHRPDQTGRTHHTPPSSPRGGATGNSSKAHVPPQGDTYTTETDGQSANEGAGASAGMHKPKAPDAKASQSSENGPPPPMSEGAEQGARAAEGNGPSEAETQSEATGAEKPKTKQKAGDAEKTEQKQQAGGTDEASDRLKAYTAKGFKAVSATATDGKGTQLLLCVRRCNAGGFEIVIDPESEHPSTYRITITPAERLPDNEESLGQVGQMVGPMIHAARAKDPEFQSLTCSTPNGSTGPAQIELKDKYAAVIAHHGVVVPQTLAAFLAKLEAGFGYTASKQDGR